MSRSKEAPRQEEEKKYQISWLVEKNVAVVQPNRNIPWVETLYTGQISDALRELGKNYKISSITPINDAHQNSLSIRSLFVVVDEKPQPTQQ